MLCTEFDLDSHIRAAQNGFSKQCLFWDYLSFKGKEGGKLIGTQIEQVKYMLGNYC